MSAMRLLLFSIAVLFSAQTHAADTAHCALCTAGVEKIGQDTPTLYHSVRGVGVGTFMYSVLHGAAYAASRRWVYGGPVGFNGVISAEVVGFFFGQGAFAANNGTDPAMGKSVKHLEKASDLPLIEGPPYKHKVISFVRDDWETMEKKCPVEVFPRFRYSEEVPLLDAMFTPTFVDALRESSKPALINAKLFFTSERAKDAPRVVLHLRRGDAKGPLKARKYTNDGYYFSCVEVIRDKYPKAEVSHVYTYIHIYVCVCHMSYPYPI
jgi:hypothetical protein